MTQRLSVIVLLAATACAPRTSLRPDFGESYAETFQAQTDLNRGTLTAPAYALSGEEGLALRARLAEEASDAETNDSDFSSSSP